MIFTGGTIAGRTNEDRISLGGAPYALLDGLESDIRAETEEPYSILSEELDASKLLILAKCIKRTLDSGSFDAIIVTHGTDTLCYTAAFLSYVFEGCEIPIILVSSGFPLDDERSNGRENFKAAIEFARLGIAGTFAVWHTNGKARVHIGSRLLRQLAFDDMLYSVGGTFGVIADGEFFRGKDIELNFSRSNMFSKIPELDRLDGFGRIMPLSFMPDSCFPFFDGSCSAVILQSYHSGTLNVNERFLRFAKLCEANDVKLFISGVGDRTAEYETAAGFRAVSNVNVLPPMSPDAAYVKLSLAASLGLPLKECADTMCGGDIFC